MRLLIVLVISLMTNQMSNALTLGDDGLYKPEWLQITFKDLHEDLGDANNLKKRFFIIFEQRGCIYCKEMHKTVFSDPDVYNLLEESFFAVQMNLFGDEEVTDFDGEVLTEKEMAKKWGVVFTPTILFFPESNEKNHSANKSAVLTMPGAFTKFTTLSLLNFVVEKGYEGEEHFQKYHARKLAEKRTNN